MLSETDSQFLHKPFKMDSSSVNLESLYHYKWLKDNMSEEDREYVDEHETAMSTAFANSELVKALDESRLTRDFISSRVDDVSQRVLRERGPASGTSVASSKPETKDDVSAASTARQQAQAPDDTTVKQFSKAESDKE